jgi:hypothetical protein
MSRYVLSYQGISDPPTQEEGALVSALENVKLVDRSPGALLVDGNESDLTRVVRQFKRWSLSPVVKVGVNPPRKRIVRTF